MRRSEICLHFLKHLCLVSSELLIGEILQKKSVDKHSVEAGVTVKYRGSAYGVTTPICHIMSTKGRDVAL